MSTKTEAKTRAGRGAKPHVPSACTNCKRAHLACDLQRPCQRCINTNKCDTCKDVQHKKRGRPRTKDRKVGGSGQSPMETQMFQFTFTAPPSPQPAKAKPASPANTSPRTPPSVPAADRQCSYLFLTPALLCLRLEEICSGNSRALLGHSLLSLINRSALDFVSDCDQARVARAFALLGQKAAEQLPGSPSRVYSHAVLSGTPPAVDPNTFQTIPVDRLLQRVCPDVCADVRAHLRTAGGGFGLFDMHLYVGAVPTGSEPRLDDIYFVSRITKFDALDCSPTSAPRIVLPRAFGDISIRPAASEPMSECRSHKRFRPAESHDSLFLLAAVTDTEAAAESLSSKVSTVTSSPVLPTPSPSLAPSPRSGSLPSISNLLKSLDRTSPQPKADCITH
ncbi:hypothetical protein LPJ79_002058 [Coemansia sp. RSA 1821]|nr:hypothetical protein LPJ79_002058 [Coemansia sp. RSA 1821]